MIEDGDTHATRFEIRGERHRVTGVWRLRLTLAEHGEGQPVVWSVPIWIEGARIGLLGGVRAVLNECATRLEIALKNRG